MVVFRAVKVDAPNTTQRFAASNFSEILLRHAPLSKENSGSPLYGCRGPLDFVGYRSLELASGVLRSVLHLRTLLTACPVGICQRKRSHWPRSPSR